MIDSKDISVVIQGPIEWAIDRARDAGITVSLSRQIRKLLPNAEIILSTWEGQKLDAIEFDRLVLSEDPGAQGVWPSYVPSNVNRQIVCTVAGLKAAKRKYALKIRTDMVLESTDFLEIFENAKPLKADTRNVFSRPVLTNNFSSRNTAEILKRLPSHPLPFHPSDHVSFGLLEDVLFLWDIPLQNDDDALYFMDHSQPNRFRFSEFSRLTPEQYIFTTALSKKVPIDIEHYADMRKEVIALSEFFMTTHIISVPDRKFALNFPKYHTDHHFHFEWMRRNPDEVLLKTYQSLPGEAAPRSRLPKPLRIVTYPFRKPAKFKARLARLFAS